MRSLFLAVVAALLVAARCDHVAGVKDPCGDYMQTCPAALGGGCCPDNMRCAAWGHELKCVYDGDTFGAEHDGGASNVVSRVFP